MDRAMVCCHGGLTFIWHNELRDLTAGLLQEVCHDVQVEPPLLPLNGKAISPTSAIRSDEAHADIRVIIIINALQCNIQVMMTYIKIQLEKKSCIDGLPAAYVGSQGLIRW